MCVWKKNTQHVLFQLSYSIRVINCMHAYMLVCAILSRKDCFSVSKACTACHAGNIDWTKIVIVCRVVIVPIVDFYFITHIYSSKTFNCNTSCILISNVIMLSYCIYQHILHKFSFTSTSRYANTLLAPLYNKWPCFIANINNWLFKIYLRKKICNKNHKCLDKICG